MAQPNVLVGIPPYVGGPDKLYSCMLGRLQHGRAARVTLLDRPLAALLDRNFEYAIGACLDS